MNAVVDTSKAQKVFLLESDLPKMVCAGQLSNRTSFQVRIDGPFGKQEADVLMKLLAAQMEVFDDLPY